MKTRRAVRTVPTPVLAPIQTKRNRSRLTLMQMINRVSFHIRIHYTCLIAQYDISLFFATTSSKMTRFGNYEHNLNYIL